MSQLYPQVAQGVLLAKLGLDSNAQAANTVHIKKLIGDLGQYQDDQGLFSYWPGGKGDVQLTAQFVDFLQDVKKAGIAVDENAVYWTDPAVVTTGSGTGEMGAVMMVAKP